MKRQTTIEIGEERGPVTPPLKWAGGKRWQLPYLREYWENNRFRRLVEPFSGGLAVALGLSPKQALLNDINPHLINFYRWLKIGLSVDLPLVNESPHYYALREEFNHLVSLGKGDSKEAAIIFYYLNRTGYNGLCRFNSTGKFNVPFGKYKKIFYRNNFFQFIDVFAQWEFTSLHFKYIPILESDFVYADPPYDVDFRQYSQDGFGWEEQVSTAELLAGHPGPVVLSNQATERILDLYNRLGYKIQMLQAPRRINCTGDRTPAKEVLATRNL